MISTNFNEQYKVDNSDQVVNLSVNIGERRYAITRLLLDGKPVPGTGPDRSFVRNFEIDLGTNGSLSAKTLVVSTIVYILLEDGKGTDVTITLTGGVSTFEKTLEWNVIEGRGFVAYEGEFRFDKKADQ